MDEQILHPGAGLTVEKLLTDTLLAAQLGRYRSRAPPLRGFGAGLSLRPARRMPCQAHRHRHSPGLTRPPAPVQMRST
jgi:hypothetical protein